MHQSIETTARSGGVPMIEGEMCCVFTLPMAPQCGVNAVVLFWRQTKRMGIYRCARGIVRGIYQPLVPAGQAFYLGMAWPKVKVPTIPRTRGGIGCN